MTEKKRIRELIEELKKASKAYYAEDREIMSNYEYDQLYDELSTLEKSSGIVYSDSPTVQVGYEAVEALPKEEHERAMLSLDKTKERAALKAFIANNRSILSWKLDGLTIVLTYRNGQLEKAVTRGNGMVGEVVTNNAKVFTNLPLKISYSGELILRGEALIRYSDFERINASIADSASLYKNPRNLCSGSVRQLNNKITAERAVRFYAFGLVKADGVEFENSHEKQMLWLQSQGFEIVPYRMVTAENLDEEVDWFADSIQTNDFPSDGLVVLYDDIAYGESLGNTAKFPRNAMAFKWADEIQTTVLKEIEWSPSRTGLINPVAIFEPVDIEGTTVSRASVHNISIVKELKLGIGDSIDVYKANMIIPQIAKNHTCSSNLIIPEVCPACGGAALIRAANEVEVLFCDNPACPAKQIKAFSLFVSRDALNMEGLSEATLEKFIAHGMIHSFVDLFRLDVHREVIVELDGFGEKSYEKLWNGIQNARKTTLSRLLFALGIQGIGSSNAKLICRAFDEDLQKIRSADREELAAIEGIGPVLAENFESWWKNEDNSTSVDELISYLEINKEFEKTEGGALEGKVVVITGSLNLYPNRNALKALIEQKGGKVTGSVSAKTSILVNNDLMSNSSKNKKAKELGVPILSEEDFAEQFLR